MKEPQPEEPQEGTLEEKLKRLQSLYEQQLITEEEYQNKKKELLGEL